jgi:hypothetical protein
MARPRRSILVLAAFCAGFGLSGCASGNYELDPAYWFPDGKKKIPGERREVFPGGVPGVTQGIPPEMVRGNPAQQADEQALAPVQEPPPQTTEKPRPRPKTAARPRPAPQPEPEAQAAPRPVQAAPRAAQPASSGAWPAPQAQQQQQPQQPQQQAPAAGAWPAPPSSGTFTR